MEPAERDRIHAVIPYGSPNSIMIQLLLAEEYDPKAGRLVGSFPQAFSHVPLVDTARTLSAPLENPRSQDAPVGYSPPGCFAEH